MRLCAVMWLWVGLGGLCVVGRGYARLHVALRGSAHSVLSPGPPLEFLFIPWATGRCAHNGCAASKDLQVAPVEGQPYPRLDPVPCRHAAGTTVASPQCTIKCMQRSVAWMR